VLEKICFVTETSVKRARGHFSHHFKMCGFSTESQLTHLNRIQCF